MLYHRQKPVQFFISIFLFCNKILTLVSCPLTTHESPSPSRVTGAISQHTVIAAGPAVKLLGKPQREIILTTANDALAIEGYQLGITDYLLKPISFGRFFTAVQKAVKTIDAKAALPAARFSNENVAVEKDYLFCKVDDRLVKIFCSDILFIESALEYVKIVTRNSFLFNLHCLAPDGRSFAAERLLLHTPFLWRKPEKNKMDKGQPCSVESVRTSHRQILQTGIFERN